MKTPVRCSYLNPHGMQCVLVAGDGHEDNGHSFDRDGSFSSPAAWRRAADGGRFRRRKTSTAAVDRNPIAAHNALDIAELERLEREATPGPWYADDAISGDGSVVMSEETGMRVAHLPETNNVHNHSSDAVFIVAARNALPVLLAERTQVRDLIAALDEATAQGEGLREEVERLRNGIDAMRETCERHAAERNSAQDFARQQQARVAQLEEALRLLIDEVRDECRCSSSGHRVSISCVKVVEMALSSPAPPADKLTARSLSDEAWEAVEKWQGLDAMEREYALDYIATFRRATGGYAVADVVTTLLRALKPEAP